MDKTKRAGFVAMGKRQKFSKGGLIRKLGKRKYFDTGGPTTMGNPTPTPADTTLGGPNSGGAFENATNPNSGLMGTIGGALGLNDNFQASGARINPGTNTAQLNEAYKGVQGALGQQGNLVNTLTPQAATAVQNQNNLAQQLYGMTQGQGPNPALAQLNQATQQNVANQNALMAGQRGASGNVGLMARQAAQRGAGTQQEAVGQGATMQAQQQIAAQQALANLASNQISQTGQATTGLNSAQQNEQSILQNANTSANNAAVGMQSNINNVNSQTAAANQNMGANIMGGLVSMGSSAMSGMSGMMGAKGGVVKPHHLTLAEMNAASLNHALKYFDEGGDVGEEVGPNKEDVAAPPPSTDSDLGSFKASTDSASAPSIGATAALPADTTSFADAAKSSSGGGGGGGGGMGSMMSMAAMLDKGGDVQSNMGSFQGTQQSSSAGPNISSTSALPADTTNFSKILSSKGDKKKDSKPGQTGEDAQQGYLDADVALGSDNREEEMPASNDTDYTRAAKGGVMSNHFHDYFAEGGAVKAMVSPGEIYLNPRQVDKVLKEGVDPAKIGKKYKGKAKVKGDSLKNDFIPDTLEEGGVVIDRKHMSTREKRELFVHRTMARKKARG